MCRQVINRLKFQRFAAVVQKAAQRHHCAIVSQFAFQPVMNARIPILPVIPYWREVAVSPPVVATRFGFAESENDVQMMFASMKITWREPKIVTGKMIEIVARRQQQRQRIQQTGFAPGVLANQNIGLFQH